MPLIKNGTIVDDPWSEDGSFLSLEAWRAQSTSQRAKNRPQALRLTPDDDVDDLGEDAHRFAVIAIDFPTFTDGRGYSAARLLRERYGYEGELRATGQVLRDQVFFMLRCGFDAFEVADTATAETFAAAVREISVVYQPAGDAAPGVLWTRQGTAYESTAASIAGSSTAARTGVACPVVDRDNDPVMHPPFSISSAS